MLKIIEGFGKKKGIDFNGRFFPLKDIAVSYSPVSQDNIKEDDIPKYDRIDMPHYRASQFYYFEQYRREVYTQFKKFPSDEEMNQSISQRLEKEFRYSYYHQFKEDITKIR